MQIVCVSCGRRIPVDDLDLSTKLAKCRVCEEVFPIDRQLVGELPPVVPRRRPLVPPRGITFDRTEAQSDDRPTSFRELAPQRALGTLVIRRRWFEAQHVFLLFFAFAWDAFLVNWYGMALGGPAPLIMILFPIAHVAVGVGITYYVLAGLLNRTTIRVADGSLEVRHGPLPWRGGVQLPVAGIQSIYVRQATKPASNGRQAIRHAVVADTDAAIESLLLELVDPSQAEFIAAALGEHLGVPNRSTLL